MAFSTIANAAGRGRILFFNPITTTTTKGSLHRHVFIFPLPRSTGRDRILHVVSAAKKLSSRTGRFDSKNRRSSSTITTTEEEQKAQQQQALEIQEDTNVVGVGGGVNVEDGYVLPELPGEQPDFWEGPQWDAFGFFIQYLWAFGIVFALIACGIAVATYNEGATDFKETPAYKESVQSQELLEGPEASDSDVFESNPTEVAPSLD